EHHLAVAVPPPAAHPAAVHPAAVHPAAELAPHPAAARLPARWVRHPPPDAPAAVLLLEPASSPALRPEVRPPARGRRDLQVQVRRPARRALPDLRGQ